MTTSTSPTSNTDTTPTSGPNDIIKQFSSYSYLLLSAFAFYSCLFLSRIWSAFIPFSSYQVFRRGAYYSVEVIPDQVAVISLNTMYFYDSNKGRRLWLIFHAFLTSVK